MPLYFGTAGDAAGLRHPFTLDATSRAALDGELARRGLFPLNVESIQRGVTSAAFWRNLIEGEVSRKTLVGFTRSLSLMLGSSIPLLEAIAGVTQRELDPDAREVFAALGRLVESGSTFHEALAQYPGVFPAYYVHSVQAGERAASLPQVLEKLAADLEFQGEIATDFMMSLIYPALLAVATFGLMGTSVFFILPRMALFYESMSIPFPAFTSAILDATNFVIANAALFGVVGLLVVYRVMTWVRTPAGSAALDRAVLKMPLIGRQVRAFRVGLVVRNLALMKESGLPLPEALEVLASGQASPEIGRALDLVRRYLEYGNPPSMAFEGAGLLGADDLRMLKAGEESDRLPFALRKVADERDREMKGIANALKAVLPILLLFLAGGIVLMLMIMVLLPTTEMLKNMP